MVVLRAVFVLALMVVLVWFALAFPWLVALAAAVAMWVWSGRSREACERPGDSTTCRVVLDDDVYACLHCGYTWEQHAYEARHGGDHGCISGVPQRGHR